MPITRIVPHRGPKRLAERVEKTINATTKRIGLAQIDMRKMLLRSDSPVLA